ncbi:hypothetical protein BCD48_05875 [Pseudofrankia sp. BMG5.36]|nr:hypothetical protein BCD48_05875 [Pseudofrankia sp. BMG5.36]
MPTQTALIRRSIIDTSIGQMMVRTSGTPDPSRPTVVLIHQMQSSGRMWTKVMSGLAAIHCVAPDIPGLGDSDAPEQWLDAPGYAEAIFETVRPLIGEAGCIVVGQHAGAVYAAYLGAAHPDLVRGVLCIGYGMYEDWSQGQRGFYDVGLHKFTADGGGLVETWNTVTKNLPPETDVQTRVECFTDRLRGGPNFFAPYIGVYTVDRDAILSRLHDSGVTAVMMNPVSDPIVTPTSRRKQLAIMGIEPLTPDSGSWITLEAPHIVCDAIVELAGRAAG